MLKGVFDIGVLLIQIVNGGVEALRGFIESSPASRLAKSTSTYAIASRKIFAVCVASLASASAMPLSP